MYIYFYFIQHKSVFLKLKKIEPEYWKLFGSCYLVARIWSKQKQPVNIRIQCGVRLNALSIVVCFLFNLLQTHLSSFTHGKFRSSIIYEKLYEARVYKLLLYQSFAFTSVENQYKQRISRSSKTHTTKLPYG